MTTPDPLTEEEESELEKFLQEINLDKDLIPVRAATLTFRKGATTDFPHAKEINQVILNAAQHGLDRVALFQILRTEHALEFTNTDVEHTINFMESKGYIFDRSDNIIKVIFAEAPPVV